MIEPLHSESAVAATPRVLIAEDDRDLRELLEEVFRDDGWTVCGAPNGTKLVDELSQAILDVHVPDVVLTDIMMPGVQVMNVLAELRAAGWTTPVIVVSARADEIAREVGGALDPIVFCQKPVALDRLLAIAHAERRSRARQTPFYRGVHPSASPRDDGPRATEAPPRTLGEPSEPARALHALLSRRPVVHLVVPDARPYRAWAERGWDLRAHGNSWGFLRALDEELATGRPLDVIALDPSLRDLDESETTRALVEADARIPVVVIGSHDHVVARLRAAGLRAFAAADASELEPAIYDAIVDDLARRSTQGT